MTHREVRELLDLPEPVETCGVNQHHCKNNGKTTIDGNIPKTAVPCQDFIKGLIEFIKFNENLIIFPIFHLPEISIGIEKVVFIVLIDEQTT